MDLITVKVHDEDHSVGVTKGTCQRGGNFRSFPSLLTAKVEFILNFFAVRNPGSRHFGGLQSVDFPDPAS